MGTDEQAQTPNSEQAGGSHAPGSEITAEIYLANLGLLMTAAGGAIAMPEAAEQLRQTIEFVIAHP
ncbi:hypothetical protein [Nocardia fluminea]|uniref:hypothetical protein n=1 Tax=Nocardia fluminea TaxID=134984 RepID=UPI0033F9948C